MDINGYRRVFLPLEGKYIYQPNFGHPVTCAAAFLQKCVVQYKSETDLEVMELGCGSGIIGIMLGLQRPGWRISGIDIQAELVELAGYNASVCNVNAAFSIGDIRYPQKWGDSFDLIVTNPPWIKMEAGIISPDRSRALARTELLCSMLDVIRACEHILRFGGNAFVLYPVFRANEFKAALANSLLDTIKIIPDKDTGRYCVFHLLRRNTADNALKRTRGVQ